MRTTTGPVCVYTGAPGQLTEVASAEQVGVTFEAQAGVTYFIMSASLEGFPGGTRSFLLFQTLDLELSLERHGEVSNATGVATVSGTVSCTAPVISNGTQGVCVCGTLRQSRRGTITNPCEPPRAGCDAGAYPQSRRAARHVNRALQTGGRDVQR